MSELATEREALLIKLEQVEKEIRQEKRYKVSINGKEHYLNSANYLKKLICRAIFNNNSIIIHTDNKVVYKGDFKEKLSWEKSFIKSNAIFSTIQKCHVRIIRKGEEDDSKVIKR